MTNNRLYDTNLMTLKAYGQYVSMLHIRLYDFKSHVINTPYTIPTMPYTIKKGCKSGISSKIMPYIMQNPTISLTKCHYKKKAQDHGLGTITHIKNSKLLLNHG